MVYTIIIKKPTGFIHSNKGELSMSIFKKTSTAEHVDNHRRLMAFAMFILSLIYAVATIRYVVDEETASNLGILAKGLAGVLLIVVIGLIIWKVKFVPRNQRYLFSSSDSYVMQALNRACIISWFSTFILLSLIKVTTSRDSSAFPAEFYINLTIFVMLAVFSVTFFILFRTDKEEIEEGAGK